MLILKDKDLLLLETTNSYRRVNLLLSHLLCAICIINSTKGCTPCASYKQMGFLSSKYPINGKHNQHQKKKKIKEKRKNPSQPHCPQLNNTWFLFIHHTHNKHGTANPRRPFLLPWEQHLFFVKHVWRQRKTIQFNWLNIFCTWNVDDMSSWQAEAA